MRADKLVLVRWQGDVIATQTLAKGQAPDVSALPPDAPVSLEVIDVTASRARFRGPFDWRPTLLVLGSVAVHAAIAAMLLASSKKASPAEIEQDRLATLRRYATKLAVNDARPTPEIHIAEESASASASAGASTSRAAPSAPSAQIPRRTPSRKKHGDAAQSSAPAVCAPPHATASSSRTCSRTVVVRSLTRSSSSCFTDDAVSVGDRGTLTFPCSGDGEAKLAFDRSSFEGAETGGELDVCTGTQFPWADGCTWTSAQSVTGSIASGTLRFTYGEAPKSGHAGACASACSATGSVEVER